MIKQQLARRLKRLAKQLDLDHWHFELIMEDSVSAGAASCEAKPEYFTAKISINLAKVSPEEMHGYLVHELLHCHVWEVVNLAEKLASTPTEMEAIRVAEERLTSRMERLLAPRVLS
jgi:hypothetical protein